MKHIHWAHSVSHQSRGAILMSEFSLPDYQRNMDELVEMFDEDNRFGMWVVSISNNVLNSVERNPIAVFMGHHKDVLKAAFCLHPVAALYHKHRQRTPGYLHLTWTPSNHDFLNMTFRGENDFMSFPEFVATRRENVSDSNSNWTCNESDDADHVNGFFYGPEAHRILLAENDHTDMIAITYHDWTYAEENQTELEALAYRCYLHSVGVLSDKELAVFFNRPFGQRRTSITY